MDRHSVTHGTFALERTYAVPPATVFLAFASEHAKASWGATDGVDLPEPAGAGGATAFNLRVGGREFFTVEMDGKTYRYDARYYDVVPDRRLVYSYEMYADDSRISVSLATIEFIPSGTGTRLIWTEQGAFLDGHDGVEAPELRRGGTAEMLDGLGHYLNRKAGR